VAPGGDCQDDDADFHPGALEEDCLDPADYNCDGSVGYADLDGDGFAACEECDDGLFDVNPDAAEVCDGLDNNCDLSTDGADAAGAVDWYADLDEDGFSSELDVVTACEAPEGYGPSSDLDDCDDEDALVNPDATEGVDDELDQDCDGEELCYLDQDGDGYRPDAVSTVTSVDLLCDEPGEAQAEEPTGDCDDEDASAYPGAPEVAGDAVDQDCDGEDLPADSGQNGEDSGGSDGSDGLSDGDGGGDGGDNGEEPGKGCGCASAPAGRSAGMLLSLALGVALLLRRRPARGVKAA
jgi:MYXO-CTERM domain-containing protein